MGVVTGGGIELRQRDVADKPAAVVIIKKGKACSTHIGTGKVGARQPGAREVRVGEVLSSEVTTSKPMSDQVDAAQIVSLIAGRRIQLLQRDTADKRVGAVGAVVIVIARKVCSTYFG